MRVFKLRQKSTGLYHCGGNSPSFHSGGKRYDSRAHCVTLINQWNNTVKDVLSPSWREYTLQRYPIPDDLEVVEFILTETESVVYQGTELVK